MATLVGKKPASARDSSDSIKHVVAHTVTESRRKGRRVEVSVDPADFSSLRFAPEVIARIHQPAQAQSTREVLHLEEYEFFAGILAGRFDAPGRAADDVVISFNYDTVLEDALAALGGGADYSFSRAQLSELRAARTPSFTVPVLKLHGSANWARTSTRGVRAQIHESYREFSDSSVPVIIPPTWKKGDLAPMFAEIWGKARAALADATRICIIGYSMPVTDPFFHHLMASALGENQGLYRLDVVDLGGGSQGTDNIWQRYKGVFQPLDRYGRLFFHDEGFNQFLASTHHSAAVRGRGSLLKSVTLY